MGQGRPGRPFQISQMFNGQGNWHPRDPSPAVRSGRDSGWTSPSGSTPGPMPGPVLQGRQGRGRDHPSIAGNFSTLVQADLSPAQQIPAVTTMLHHLPMQYVTQAPVQQQIQYSTMLPEFQIQEVHMPQVQVVQEVQMMQEVLQPVFLQPQHIQIQEIQEVVYLQEPPPALSPKPLRPPPLRERPPPPPPPPPPIEHERHRERAVQPPPPPPEPEIKYIDR